MRILLLIITIFAASCYGTKEVQYHICPKNHTHGDTYYMEDSAGYRLYFYNQKQLENMKMLIKKDILSTPQLFEAFGLKRRYPSLIDSPYCSPQIVDYSRWDIITIWSISIQEKTPKGKSENIILIETTVEFMKNSGICIPIKMQKPLNKIDKNDIIGYPKICILEI